MSHRALAGLLLAVVLSVPVAAAAARPDPSMESLLVALDLERRARAEDLAEVDRLTAAALRADTAAAAARQRLLDVLRGGDADATDLRDDEERVVEAEARARAAQETRRAAVSRLVERTRRIGLLQDEIARRRGTRRPADPLTGRWQTLIDPGGRRGVYRLSLDGTLLSGDYVLDGGFRGSLRGTFVGERVTIQRIDSERGFDATFYGRVQAQLKRITGTWEATAIAPATGPVAGTWSATMLPDEDDDGGSP